MLNKTNLKFGVIGVGSMGQNHARIYSEISNLEGVSDLNKEQLKIVSERYSTNAYSDYVELLEQVDAVSIAVPTKYHFEVAHKAIKMGKHVLIEKPICDKTDKAKILVDLAKQKGTIIAVGHIERYNPVISFVYEKLKNNYWGDIISLSSKRLSSYPARIKDVNIVYDLAIHDIDIISYLANSDFSQGRLISGNLSKSDLEDHASIQIEFSNGIKGMCEVSWLTPIKIRELCLNCTEAFVVVDYINQTVKTMKSTIEAEEKNLYRLNQEIYVANHSIVKKEPLKAEIMDFINSVLRNSEPLVSGADGLKALNIIELLK